MTPKPHVFRQFPSPAPVRCWGSEVVDGMGVTRTLPSTPSDFACAHHPPISKANSMLGPKPTEDKTRLQRYRATATANS